MDDLVQWLREQLDEDERDAKERRGIFPSPGVNDDGSVCLHVRPGGNMAITWYRHPTEGWDDMAKLRNWANTKHGWTQERVLREIDAKRQLVNAHARPHECVALTGRGDRSVVDGQPWELWEPEHTGDHGPCTTLRLLALPYADRPGYREEWRP